MGQIWNSTLQRKTALRAKGTLKAKRPFWMRSKTPHTSEVEAAPRPRRSGLAQMSKKQARNHRKYLTIRRAFLNRLENTPCYLCLTQSIGASLTEIRALIAEHPRRFLEVFGRAGATWNRSTEVHHAHGRIGRLLCYEPYFIPSCSACRDWPHDNPARARELGMLAPAAPWNVFPSTSDGSK